MKSFKALILSVTLNPSARILPASFGAPHPALATLGFAFLALSMLAVIAQGFDPRIVDGVNVWVKPSKFLISLGVFILTMVWCMGFVAKSMQRSFSLRIAAAGVFAAALFEIAYISLQAMRGEPSHFYVSHPFHRLMYSLMGIAALILTSSQLVVAHALWRNGKTELSSAFRLSLVLGLVLTFLLGTVTGLVMSVRGQRFATAAASYGPMLPFFGWSLAGGDWRVAHFLGLHAQQALPMAGWLTQRFLLPSATRVIWIVTILYAAWTLWMLFRAAQGHPFLPLE